MRGEIKYPEMLTTRVPEGYTDRLRAVLDDKGTPGEFLRDMIMTVVHERERQRAERRG